MSRKIVFELCAEGLEACLAAREGGAQRIELCAALSEGGLTPSHALLSAAVQQSGLPVYVLLRPRGGNFTYNDREFALIEQDLRHARELGANGFVVGALDAEGRIEQRQMRRLVDLADGLEVTFHRAFDVSQSLADALEEVIDTGCRRLLSSGGAVDVEAGAEQLCRLREQAAGRIEIAVGGGLRLASAAHVAAVTGATHFHASVRRPRQVHDTPQHRAAFGATMETCAEDIRAMIAALGGSS
jgi:copper homeostasis protein